MREIRQKRGIKIGNKGGRGKKRQKMMIMKTLCKRGSTEVIVGEKKMN